MCTSACKGPEFQKAVLQKHVVMQIGLHYGSASPCWLSLALLCLVVSSDLVLRLWGRCHIGQPQIWPQSYGVDGVGADLAADVAHEVDEVGGLLHNGTPAARYVPKSRLGREGMTSRHTRHHSYRNSSCLLQQLLCCIYLQPYRC